MSRSAEIRLMRMGKMRPERALAVGGGDWSHEHTRVEKAHELPMTGNTKTFNMNTLLAQRIITSDYFRSLAGVDTFPQIVDEIYSRVEHVEPWSPGTARIPSTAFCLLYKLCVMRATKKQMRVLLTHADSPYIRAIGFLYLRYTLPRDQLWTWFGEFITDEEEFAPSADGRMLPMGDFCSMLLRENKFFGTVLPRIPVKIERELKVKLLAAEEAAERALANEHDRHLFVVGAAVRCLFSEDSKWYAAVIDEYHSDDDTFTVTYTDYGNVERVPLGRMVHPSQRKKKNKGSGGSGGGGGGSGGSGSSSAARRGGGSGGGSSGGGGGGGGGGDDEDLMSKVLARERDRAAASGSSYSRRVTTYKDALSLRQDRYT
eukprot:PLAT5403.1.p1 GENE.PLAT5403.1~~PLAT5403.1.p1  ORF type:complete len:373 (+),score=185.14 PLAT5403.1:150-1268(+)